MSSALATQPEPAPVAKGSQPRLTNNALLAGAGAILLLGPLAFGAVEPWSIFALEASAMLLLAVWASRQWIKNASANRKIFRRPRADWVGWPRPSHHVPVSRCFHEARRQR